MWLNNAIETRRFRGDQIEVFKMLNGYENIYRNILFSLKKHSRTRGHEVKLVKHQCRLDITKTINEWYKLSTDCVTASSVNMSKNKVDTSQEGRLHVDEKILDSISQWLPHPLAIWAFALDGNFVKHGMGKRSTFQQVYLPGLV